MRGFLEMTDAELVFWAAIVGHIATPVAVVTVMLVFRRPLGALIESVAELEIFGVKAKVSKNIEALAAKTSEIQETPLSDDVAEDASAAPVPTPAAAPSEPSSTLAADEPVGEAPRGDHVIEPAHPVPQQTGKRGPKPHHYGGDVLASTLGLNPTSMVLTAWLDVEEALRDAAARAGVTADRIRDMHGISLARALKAGGWITPDTFELTADAALVRDQALHMPSASNITFTEASAYSVSARGIAKAIRRESGVTKDAAISTVIMTPSPGRPPPQAA